MALNLKLENLNPIYSSTTLGKASVEYYLSEVEIAAADCVSMYENLDTFHRLVQCRAKKHISNEAFAYITNVSWSTEGFVDTIKKIWKWICDKAKALWRAVKNFFLRLFGKETDEDKEKKAKAIEAAAKDAKVAEHERCKKIAREYGRRVAEAKEKELKAIHDQELAAVNQQLQDAQNAMNAANAAHAQALQQMANSTVSADKLKCTYAGCSYTGNKQSFDVVVRQLSNIHAVTGSSSTNARGTGRVNFEQFGLNAIKLSIKQEKIDGSLLQMHIFLEARNRWRGSFRDVLNTLQQSTQTLQSRYDENKNLLVDSADPDEEQLTGDQKSEIASIGRDIAKAMSTLGVFSSTLSKACALNDTNYNALEQAAAAIVL